jgi:hypothetical protein
MAITININNLTLCHKGSDGVSTATIPDVCKTPSPGGPVPVPYPNVAFSADLMKGTTTVKADGGMMCANYGSEFFKSTGDEPGVVGGVLSSTFVKEATWITFSFDVKLQGNAACRLTDKMFHNHQNTVDATGLGQKSLELKPGNSCHKCVSWKSRWTDGPHVVDESSVEPPVVPEMSPSGSGAIVICWKVAVVIQCKGAVECVCEWCGNKKSVQFETKKISRSFAVCRPAGLLDMVPFIGSGVTAVSRRMIQLLTTLRTANTVLSKVAAMKELSELVGDVGLENVLSSVSLATACAEKLLNGAASAICDGSFDEAVLDRLWDVVDRVTAPAGIPGMSAEDIA